MSGVTTADAAAIARDMRSADTATSDSALRVIVGMDRTEHIQMILQLVGLLAIEDADLDDLAAKARAWEASRG